MSDQDENRPLTRRERRLREMAATGEAPQKQAATTPPVAEPVAQPVSGASPAAEIDIPLFDETGRMRSRRELRELREQAEAALAAENADDSEAVEYVDEIAPDRAEPEVEDAALSEAASELEQSTEPLSPAVDASEPEPEQSAAAEADENAVEAVDAAEAADPASTEEAEILAALGGTMAAPVAEEAPLEAALEDTVAFDVISDQQVAEAERSAAQGTASEEGLEQNIFVVPAQPVESELEAVSDVQLEPEDELEEVDGSDEIDERDSDVAEPVSATSQSGYSFPDIAPLDEGQSVFDDPAIRMMGAANAQSGVGDSPSGDFDELISRAVAQEGATGSSTSALILPSMPDGEGLAGPLGDTGELYITGSIDLPKSLGETGGHAALHDSVEVEPFDALGFSEEAPADKSMAPVSASRAVSARGNQGPLVTEATKDKSKLPVALIATGGVLVVAAAGLIIWAATSGLFG